MYISTLLYYWASIRHYSVYETRHPTPRLLPGRGVIKPETTKKDKEEEEKEEEGYNAVGVTYSTNGMAMVLATELQLNPRSEPFFQATYGE